LANTSLEIWSPAKVNLGLNVLGKRADGYHDIYTVFVAVDLYDRLRFTQTSDGGVHLRLGKQSGDHATPEAFPLGEENLIVKAVHLVEREIGLRSNLDIEIQKQIPIAAGLGGGSSNAAAALRAMQRLYNLDIGDSTLREWAAQLGSDVPFFLGNAMAEGSGRGEVLHPLNLFSDWWIVLVCPPVFLSAGEVYGQLRLTSPQPIPRFTESRDREGFFATLRQSHNDLEPVVMRRVPVVCDWLEHLKESGAERAFVSGSGPTTCGLFEHRPSESIVRAMRDRQPGVQVFTARPVQTAGALLER